MNGKEECGMDYKKYKSGGKLMKLLSEPVIVYNDYKLNALYIPIGVTCDFKCVKEAKAKGLEFMECHNHEFINKEKYEMSTDEVLTKIQGNPFIECIILSGLEPMDCFKSVSDFISEFREKSDMEIVIFTGYYANEVTDKLKTLKRYDNITFKFGRYDPSAKPRYDEVGKVTLISGNQYFSKLESINV
jgi:hypothetical protein